MSEEAEIETWDPSGPFAHFQGGPIDGAWLRTSPLCAARLETLGALRLIFGDAQKCQVTVPHVETANGRKSREGDARNRGRARRRLRRRRQWQPRAEAPDPLTPAPRKCGVERCASMIRVDSDFDRARSSSSLERPGTRRLEERGAWRWEGRRESRGQGVGGPSGSFLEGREVG